MTLPSAAPPRQPRCDRGRSPAGRRRRVPADYEVGYKKPPRHTRFRRGRSGNPNGRPKQARKPADRPARGAAAADHRARGRRRAPDQPAAGGGHAVARKALKGELGAMAKLLDLVLRHEAAAGGALRGRTPRSRRRSGRCSRNSRPGCCGSSDGLPDDEPASAEPSTETPT